jgi:hypothetical protein
MSSAADDRQQTGGRHAASDEQKMMCLRSISHRKRKGGRRMGEFRIGHSGGVYYLKELYVTGVG